ncbi:MAG: hypothetical protein KA479_09170 [Saprospiraceae bacterium]|nr:hypothetical protein [Saprospiraceae bacterium]
MRNFLDLPIETFEVVDCNQHPARCTKDLAAFIHCLRKGHVIATCYFYRDDFKLPQSYYDGDRFKLMFHNEVYAEVCTKIKQLSLPRLSDVISFKPSYEPGLLPVNAYSLPTRSLSQLYRC